MLLYMPSDQSIKSCLASSIVPLSVGRYVSPAGLSRRPLVDPFVVHRVVVVGEKRQSAVR